MGEDAATQRNVNERDGAEHLLESQRAYELNFERVAVDRSALVWRWVVGQVQNFDILSAKLQGSDVSTYYFSIPV